MGPLAFALSTLGTVCLCVPSLLKGKNMKAVLLLIFFANVFVGAAYALNGSFSGAVTCGVGAVQTVINYFFERKDKPIPRYLIVLYALAFTAVNIAVFRQIADCLTLLAALMFVLGISVKSGKNYRLCALANTVLWIAYDCLTLSFGPLTTHGIQLATILFGMVMHDRKTNHT